MPVHEVALLLGIGLRWEAMPPDTTARRIQSPRPEIIINAVFEGDPVVWRRRLRQAVAHEIMALRVGVGEEETQAEAILERCASELVLYRPWLERAAAEHERELPVIADVFDVTAEAAAWGLLDLGPAVLTIVDAGRITTRVSSHGLACPGGVAARGSREVGRLMGHRLKSGQYARHTTLGACVTAAPRACSDEPPRCSHAAHEGA